MKFLAFLILTLSWATTASAQFCPRGQLLSLLPSIDSWYIPQSGMLPTLKPGDCLTTRTITDPAEIESGRIAVFSEGPTKTIFLFRIVATAGQTVQMRNGALWINGTPVPRTALSPYLHIVQLTNGTPSRCPTPTAVGDTCEIKQFQEVLGNTTYATLDLGKSPYDDTDIFVVPPDHVFVLGDHRDNAADSRMARDIGGRGFVPIDRIIGIVSRK